MCLGKWRVVFADGAEAEKSEGVEPAPLVGVRKLESSKTPIGKKVRLKIRPSVIEIVPQSYPE